MRVFVTLCKNWTLGTGLNWHEAKLLLHRLFVSSLTITELFRCLGHSWGVLICSCSSHSTQHLSLPEGWNHLWIEGIQCSESTQRCWANRLSSLSGTAISSSVIRPYCTLAFFFSSKYNYTYKNSFLVKRNFSSRPAEAVGLAQHTDKSRPTVIFLWSVFLKYHRSASVWQELTSGAIWGYF